MGNTEQFPERRAFKRIPANIPVKFFYGSSVYFGTVKDFSENSMFVSTNRILFPLHSKLEIFVPSIHHGALKLSVKVARLAKTDGYYNGIGVQLLNETEENLAEVFKSLSQQ
jgi:hypothetical protein